MNRNKKTKRKNTNLKTDGCLVNGKTKNNLNEKKT